MPGTNLKFGLLFFKKDDLSQNYFCENKNQASFVWKISFHFSNFKFSVYL